MLFTKYGFIIKFHEVILSILKKWIHYHSLDWGLVLWGIFSSVMVHWYNGIIPEQLVLYQYSFGSSTAALDMNLYTVLKNFSGQLLGFSVFNSRYQVCRIDNIASFF